MLNEKYENLKKENYNNSMQLVTTINELVEKLDESQSSSQNLRSKNEDQKRQIGGLGENIKNLEKKIEDYITQISKISNEYVPVEEKENLLKEIESLRKRYSLQEDILKASYNKVLDITKEEIKGKLKQQFNENNPNFEEMAQFLELERENWTNEYNNLLRDLKHKTDIIEELEKEKEESRIKQQGHDKLKAENDQTLKDKVNNLERNLENLTISYQTLVNKHLNLKNELKQRYLKSKELYEENKKLKINLKKLAHEINDLKNNLNQKNDSLISNYENPQRTHAKIKKNIKGGGGNLRVFSILKNEPHDYKIIVS